MNITRNALTTQQLSAARNPGLHTVLGRSIIVYVDIDLSTMNTSVRAILSAQNNFVAMATSLDKSENKVQIHHLHLKCFPTVKRLRKSVQYIRRYSTKDASFLAVSYQRSIISSVNSGTKFTNFDTI